MTHELPKLAFSFDALEPYMDAKTVELHYSKHHQAYCDKMNEVLEKYPDLADKDPVELMKNLERLKMDETDKLIFRNQGGGYINHNLYWDVLGPEKEIDETLVNEIKETFGSVEEFKKQFSQAASTQFASGWAWLVKDENGKLLVYSTQNHDSPYIKGHNPIVNIDVWEHAYYLKYQNRRAEFIENWWNILKLI